MRAGIDRKGLNFEYKVEEPATWRLQTIIMI